MQLILRKVLQSDVSIFFEQMQDKDQLWRAAFVAKDPSDIEAHHEHWTKILANPETLNRTIELDGLVIGNIARYYMDNVPQITYWLGSEYSGRGYGTAALGLFLRLEVRRPLEARTAFDNKPSARVLEKNGFRVTGTDQYFSNARNAEIEETIWVLE